MTSLLLRKDLKYCCRTCLNDLSTKMYDLFEEKKDSPSVSEILSLFTNILVQTEDMLPKNLCSSCYNCLLNFYDFKKLAEKVDLQLHHYYDNFIPADKSSDVEFELPLKNEVGDSDEFEIEFDLATIKTENSDSCVSEHSYPIEYKLETKKTVKKKQYFKCPECQKKFITQDKLQRHLVAHKTHLSNESEPVKCDICSASFPSANSLAAHTRKHVPKGRVLSCQHCGKVFKKTSHLKRHEASHDVNRKYKCTLCTKGYHLESQLAEHMHKHSGVKPHPCPICPKAFAHLSTFNNHLRLHTRGKPYLCPTCGKGFNSSTNMKQHVKRHLGLKDFACNLCPWKFVSAGALKSHKKTHTGEKPYKCKHCPATFTATHSLKIHTLKHLGHKPFQCEVCPMKFTTKDYLASHTRTHTGEKPFRCDLCERTFSQTGDLLKHKRAHLGINMYKCDQCTQSFRLKSQLRNHISEHYVSALKTTDIIADAKIQNGDGAS